MVREFIYDFVKKAYHNPKRIKEINETILVIIPRIDHLEMLKDFRSISLYNVVYKIISKVIASCFKRIMPIIISPNQCNLL